MPHLPGHTQILVQAPPPAYDTLVSTVRQVSIEPSRDATRTVAINATNKPCSTEKGSLFGEREHEATLLTDNGNDGAPVSPVRRLRHALRVLWPFKQRAVIPLLPNPLILSLESTSTPVLPTSGKPTIVIRVRVQNPNQLPVAFKLVTTHQKLACVNPNFGTVAVGAVLDLEISIEKSPTTRSLRFALLTRYLPKRWGRAKGDLASLFSSPLPSPSPIQTQKFQVPHSATEVLPASQAGPSSPLYSEVHSSLQLEISSDLSSAAAISNPAEMEGPPSSPSSVLLGNLHRPMTNPNAIPTPDFLHASILTLTEQVSSLSLQLAEDCQARELRQAFSEAGRPASLQRRRPVRTLMYYIAILTPLVFVLTSFSLHHLNIL